MSTRAISYIRFSTHDQRLGDSERRQLEKAEAYCKANGLTLAPSDVLRDLGLSAYRGSHRKQGAFAGFLAAIRDRRIPAGTVLIVEAWDRLSREPPLRSLNQMTEIVLAGIKIITLIDGQEHDEAALNAQPHRLFHSLAMIIAANAESAQKAKRVKESWEGRHRLAKSEQKRLTSIRPAWLDIDPNTGKLVPNEGANTVRRIYREIADGMGCYLVARRLQKEYEATGQPAPLSGGKQSMGWSKTRVHHIVTSDAPLGVLSVHKLGPDGKKRVFVEKIEGYYPAVVEQSLADRARAALKRRKYGGAGAGAKGEYTNLLAGIAKCVCGKNMVLTNRHPKQQQWGWLRCSRVWETDGCYNRASIKYLPLEEAVLRDVGWYGKIKQQLPKYDPSWGLAEQIAAKQAEAERHEQTIAALSNTFGENPLPAIAAQIRERAERHAALAGEIEDLQRQKRLSVRKSEDDDFFDSVERNRMLALATSMDPKNRFEARARIATALRDMLAGIICYPDKTIRINFPEVEIRPLGEYLTPDDVVR
jgi:DNA invertase Pin-like site-specific DNA recombinase